MGLKKDKKPIKRPNRSSRSWVSAWLVKKVKERWSVKKSKVTDMCPYLCQESTLWLVGANCEPTHQEEFEGGRDGSPGFNLEASWQNNNVDGLFFHDKQRGWSSNKPTKDPDGLVDFVIGVHGWEWSRGNWDLMGSRRKGKGRKTDWQAKGLA